MGSHHQLSAELLGLVFLCFMAQSISSTSLRGEGSLVGTKGTESKDPNDVSCYKDNGEVPMVGIVPHLFDCNRYYACIPDIDGRPYPHILECQRGHEGELLHYDFQNCWCEDAAIAECYNHTSEEHQQKRFACAEEVAVIGLP